TVKSRMFSQTSAKGRLSSVPSPESEFTRSYTLEASCNNALRTSMNDLPSLGSGSFERRYPLRCGCERLPHACPRGPSRHVVTIQSSVQRDSGVKILAELLAKLAQLFER